MIQHIDIKQRKAMEACQGSERVAQKFKTTLQVDAMCVVL